MLFGIFSIGLLFTYVLLLGRYLYGWRALPGWRIPPEWKPNTRISVLIPARNEAANIRACLLSILEVSYPAHLLEIIVVDDHSGDGTAEVVRQFSGDFNLSENSAPALVLLSLAGHLKPDEVVRSFKKKALEIGIARAKGDLIVTTDADCIAPKDWLLLVTSVFEEKKEVKILASPVAFHREYNLLQRFQSLDFLGLIGITGAGIQLGRQRMGNGANLAYPKAAFEAIGGFTGNEHRASGDDMFLIQKVAAQWPGSVFFLKTPAAAVLTEAKADWRSFFQQRLRWGTKNAALPEWPVRLALLAVFLFCWSIWLNLFRWNAPGFVLLAVFQLLVKAIADYAFLREMCRFFKREDLLRWFVPSFFLHTLYIPLVGTASLFVKKYEWKERMVD